MLLGAIKEALEILAQEPKDEDDDEVPDGNDIEEVFVSYVYTMSGHIVLNIQSQVENEWRYIQYNTNASTVNNS